VRRRPSIPRSRSASQVSGFMAEAMASRFEGIVAGCKGRVVRQAQARGVPGRARGVPREQEVGARARPPGAGPRARGCTGGARERSARGSSMSEIADMLKEVDWPRLDGAGRGKEGVGEGGTEGERGGVSDGGGG